MQANPNVHYVRKVENRMDNESAFDAAAMAVLDNAAMHREKTPNLGTLLEEVAELVLSLRGKHEHAPEVELEEIGGIAINWLRVIYIQQWQRAAENAAVVSHNGS